MFYLYHLTFQQSAVQKDLNPDWNTAAYITWFSFLSLSSVADHLRIISPERKFNNNCCFYQDLFSWAGRSTEAGGHIVLR
jgi:hypothetical protein